MFFIICCSSLFCMVIQDYSKSKDDWKPTHGKPCMEVFSRSLYLECALLLVRGLKLFHASNECVHSFDGLGVVAACAEASHAAVSLYAHHAF